jgi:alcohol dehydrogenase class IV
MNGILISMRYNYAITVAVLSVCHGLARSFGGGIDSHKGVGLAILGIIVGVPIALFFDWRAAVKERREQLAPPSE